MGKKIRIAAGLLLFAAGQASALSVRTDPSEVTLYPSGAQVLRRGSGDLPAGAQKITFEGLPSALREDSLRLKVEGPQGTLVYGLNLRQAFSADDQARKRAGLSAKIQALEDQKADLADRRAARDGEAEILKALAEKGAARAGAESGPKVAELAASVAVVGKRLEALALASRRDERAQRGIDQALAALKAELAQAGPKQLSSRVAEADLELASAGSCRFELSYFVDNAGWAPRYDIRLHAADKEPKAEIDFLAEARQLSGEDWNGVALKLSTARPTLDSQVPDPTNWWLDFPQARLNFLQAPSRAAKGQAAMPEAAALQPEDSMPEAAQAQAAAQDLGPATLFVVKRRADIPSSQAAQRVLVSKGTHPAELTLVVVPRLSPAAYLEANILYSGEGPMLPGPAQLFRDGDLAGQAQMAPVAPGEAFRLGFGMDERVKAGRKRRAQKRGSAGFLGGHGKLIYDWDIKVSNFHEGPRDIEVREQLPRSRQEDIKVSALELDPKPMPEDPSRPGLLIWKWKLNKGEEKALRLRYEVSWPEGKLVEGLE